MKGLLTMLTLVFMVSGALAAPDQDEKKDSREAMLLNVLRDLTKEVAGLRSEIKGISPGAKMGNDSEENNAQYDSKRSKRSNTNCI
jgi:uncharacterized protein YlxW (UPF0749 family)